MDENLKEFNRNKEVATLYAIWILHNKEKPDYKIEWDEFVKLFFTDYYKFYGRDFQKALDDYVEGYDAKGKIEKNVENLEKKWNDFGIKSIVVDDFKTFVGLKDVKNCLFFFYIGDLKLLETSIDEKVCIVGGRDSDKRFFGWLKQNYPNKKIVVSGLAKGADCWGHLTAIARKEKIVVVPPYDVYSNQNLEEGQKVILQYAKKNGLILMNVIPFSKIYSRNNFLNRNKWMAQMSGETYACDFLGYSGTISTLLETAKLNRKILVPNEVIEKNRKFLENHKTFKIVLDKMVGLDFDENKISPVKNKKIEKQK